MLPGDWDLAHAIRLGIKPFAELGANSEALSGSQVDSPCSCRAILESAPVAMLQSRIGTGYPARGRSPSPCGHRTSQLTTLQTHPRSHLLGGPGHGTVDRVADPPSLQARTPAPLRRGDPHRSSLCVARQRLGIAPVRHLFEQIVHPLARPETPGAFYRGLRLVGLDGTVYDVPDSDANASAFSRSSAGPRGAGPSPKSASSVWSSWGPTPNSPSWSGPAPTESNPWSAACSAI